MVFAHQEGPQCPEEELQAGRDRRQAAPGRCSDLLGSGRRRGDPFDRSQRGDVLPLWTALPLQDWDEWAALIRGKHLSGVNRFCRERPNGESALIKFRLAASDRWRPQQHLLLVMAFRQVRPPEEIAGRSTSACP
jgi:hypothetical protein